MTRPTYIFWSNLRLGESSTRNWESAIGWKRQLSNLSSVAYVKECEWFTIWGTSTATSNQKTLSSNSYFFTKSEHSQDLRLGLGSKLLFQWDSQILLWDTSLFISWDGSQGGIQLPVWHLVCWSFDLRVIGWKDSFQDMERVWFAPDCRPISHFPRLHLVF